MNCDDYQHKSLPTLIEGCRDNNQAYMESGTSDPCFCLELLRRAVGGNDEDAWTACYEIYMPQFEARARRKFSNLDSEMHADCLQNGWIKLIGYLTLDKMHDRTLVQVRALMNLCIDGAFIDCLRRRNRPIPSIPEWQTDTEWRAMVNELAEQCLIRIYAAFDEIAEKEDAAVTEKLRIAFAAVFFYDLKPREIAEQYPDYFDSAADASNTIRRVMRIIKRACKSLRD